LRADGLPRTRGDDSLRAPPSTPGAMIRVLFGF
jgi:hypothetical protein